jgi:hypothetical protein
VLDGVRVELEYAGPADSLVRALAGQRVVDVEIEKASLEQIFLDLYRDDVPA